MESGVKISWHENEENNFLNKDLDKLMGFVEVCGTKLHVFDLKGRSEKMIIGNVEDWSNLDKFCTENQDFEYRINHLKVIV